MTHIWVRNALVYAGFFDLLKKGPDYLSYLVLLGSIILTFILANKYFKKLYDFIMGHSLKLFQKVIK